LAATRVNPEVTGVQELLLQLLLDYGPEIEKQNLAGNNQGAVISCLANGRPRAGAFLAARGARLDLESAGGGAAELAGTVAIRASTTCRADVAKAIGKYVLVQKHEYPSVADRVR
jgi:hypothetical protein